MNDIENVTRVNMDTISILKQFVDTYCEGTQLNDLIDGEADVKLSTVREVSKYIMSCCENLLPLISDEKAKPHEYKYNTDFPVYKIANEKFVYDSCKTIDCNIYWHSWEFNEDHPLTNVKYYIEDDNGHKIKDKYGEYIEYEGHGESIYLLSSIRKLCKESNYSREYNPYFSYKDIGFDKNNIIGDIPNVYLHDESLWKNLEPRILHLHCVVNSYYGPVKADSSKIVSQIRTKRCGNSKTGVHDVLTLMYHMLYDHCVQKAFFRNRIERKNKHKMVSFIEEDLKSNSSSLNIVILRECIVRVKMAIFLRIFQGSCCSGRVIDKRHWSEIQNLCRLVDKMSAYKYSLENPGDEDEDIEETQEKEIVNFIGNKKRRLV